MAWRCATQCPDFVPEETCKEIIEAETNLARSSMAMVSSPTKRTSRLLGEHVEMKHTLALRIFVCFEELKIL